jgi:transposase-like protein
MEGDSNRQDVRWSPRVPKWKLRRFYDRCCQGIWDEELINEIGLTLYLRCRDILTIHRAKTQLEVTCPRCEHQGRDTRIDRRGRRDSAMTCPVCGWTMTWRAYHRTFQRKQLNPGGAVAYFQAFVTGYETARDPRTKALAIDRLIHEFHYSNRQRPDQPTRPAGVNLIVGDLEDVVQFLDELSGLNLPVPMRATETEWREKYAATYWPHFLRSRGTAE